jgi:hypothetical protein
MNVFRHARHTTPFIPDVGYGAGPAVPAASADRPVCAGILRTAANRGLGPGAELAATCRNRQFL